MKPETTGFPVPRISGYDQAAQDEERLRDAAKPKRSDLARISHLTPSCHLRNIVHESRVGAASPVATLVNLRYDLTTRPGWE